MGLQQIQAGTVGWDGTMNANIAFLRLPPGYVWRLGLTYVSSTQLTLAAGSARDGTDTTDIALVSAQTLDVTVGATPATNGTAGTVNGIDVLKSAATISTTNASANATASASIFSEMQIYTVGSITFSYTNPNTTLTASADVRGQVAIGDLVGSDTTYGMSRVTAIDTTGTSLTLAAALPNGTSTSGTPALRVVENPVIRAANTGSDVRRINTIKADGVTITVDSNWGSASTNVALYHGSIIPSSSTATTWYSIWLISNGTTPGGFVSSKRLVGTGTFLNKPTGYTTMRRVGWLRTDTSGNVLPFTQKGAGPDRTNSFEINLSAYSTRLLTGGGATSWTRVPATAVAPPTCRRIVASLLLYKPASASSMAFRESGVGETTANRPIIVACVPAISDEGNTMSWLNLDAAQAFDYAVGGTDANNPAYVDGTAFEDSLS